MSAALLLLSRAASASREYEFTGKVTGIRGDTIAISHGIETLEFDRAGKGQYSGLKVGDTVTVRYRLAPTAIRPEAAQRPGRAAPESHPSGSPLEKKQIIIDDRAFYDAGQGHSAGDPSRPQS